MPQRSPLSEIPNLLGGVEEFEANLSVNMWDYDSNGLWWVHTYSIIYIPPGSDSLYFCTTLQNSEGDVPITVYPSIKRINHLVRMN